MGEVVRLRASPAPGFRFAPRDVLAAPRAAGIPSAAIFSFPADGSIIDTARDVLARPDDFREDQLRDACQYLRDHGGWMDGERAIALVRALDRQAAQRAATAAEEAAWVREWRELCLACVFFLILLAGIAAFDVAWGRHLWAGVR